MKAIVNAWMLAAALSVQGFAADKDQNATAPDNTGANSYQSPTAQDQSESPQDRDLTQRIRSSLMQANQLSSNAKNVKVITQDGKVTLRGPVSNDQEKNVIGSVAEGIAGKGNVSNELEVQSTPQQ